MMGSEEAKDSKKRGGPEYMKCADGKRLKWTRVLPEDAEEDPNRMYDKMVAFGPTDGSGIVVHRWITVRGGSTEEEIERIKKQEEASALESIRSLFGVYDHEKLKKGFKRAFDELLKPGPRDDNSSLPVREPFPEVEDDELELEEVGVSQQCEFCKKKLKPDHLYLVECIDSKISEFGVHDACARCANSFLFGDIEYCSLHVKEGGGGAGAPDSKRHKFVNACKNKEKKKS